MAAPRYVTEGKGDKEGLHLNLARLKKGGDKYEFPVDCNAAIRFKEGANVDIKEVMKAPHIFYDAHKGELASEIHMESVFGTKDPFKIGQIILKEGELQLTTEIRDAERERKKSAIIARISREAIDPKTKLPHPPQR